MCGQVAIAALSGCSVDDAISAVGHSRSTKTRELIPALRALGLSPLAERCRLMPRPDFGIAQVHAPGRSGWHWVAVDGDKTYDGVWGDASGVPRWPECFRITSYLPVERPWART